MMETSETHELEVETEIIHEIDKIQTKYSSTFHNDLLLIYYNALIENPMNSEDYKSLFAYLKEISVKRITAILFGSGGCLTSGLIMGKMLQDLHEYFEVFVPFSCCSSMCYIFLQAKKLILLPSANITQIDPIGSYDGENIRLIRASEIKSLDVSSDAKYNFAKIRDKIVEILKSKKSLYDHDCNVYLTDYEKIEELVDLFMNKEEHASKITFEELRKLNFKVQEILDKELETDFRKLFEIAQEILLKHNERFLIVSTATLQQHGRKVLISQSR